MLLAIDIGNTNFTFGVFDGEKLESQFRMTTKGSKTSDEYGMFLCDLIEHNKVDINQIEDVIVASVVPGIMHSFCSGVIKYLNKTPLLVSAGVKTGIRIATDNPKQLGPDRIVDAVAAYNQYGGPVLVVDFGTATTFDLVDGSGTFLAGVTAPGLTTAGKALWSEAAMLPEIEIRKPESILAKETVSSMQAGLVYGYIGQTEYIIQKMREESGFEDMKVVATGGVGKIIARETDLIDVYDPILTLNGLRMIYNKNKKK